jgi:pimeloyl-ACP methyl ester carboxylesterase
MTPSLLFLPGHMCDDRAWAPVADRLAAAGYPGSHARLDRDASIDDMAARVLAEHPGPFIAIGFSMGAIAALALHRAAPDRGAGLCLVGINAGADLPERSSVRIDQQARVRLGELATVMQDQVLPHYFAAACAEEERLGALCLDMALAVGPDAFVRQSEALRLRPDGRPGLAAIACPALVVSAEEDRLCPPDWHTATAAAIPGAALRSIAAAGHMALIERPDAMAAAILDWLRDHWPETTHA